jgi:hypothetical protein
MAGTARRAVRTLQRGVPAGIKAFSQRINDGAKREAFGVRRLQRRFPARNQSADESAQSKRSAFKRFLQLARFLICAMF